MMRTILVELPGLANLAAFLPADGCTSLTRQTIVIDGAHAPAQESLPHPPPGLVGQAPSWRDKEAQPQRAW